MDSGLDNHNKFLPQIKAAVSTWENTWLKNRILPPELIEPLRESRDFKSPILSETEYLDLAMFLGCKAVENGPGWSKRLLSCMSTLDPSNRNGFCKRKFQNGEDKCRPLCAFIENKSKVNQQVLFEVEPKVKSSLNDLAINAPREVYYTEELTSWMKGEFTSADGMVYPKPPVRLKNALIMLANNGIESLDNNNYCGRTSCSHDCVQCIDGALRGVWENRVEFFDNDKNFNGTSSTNYLVPRKIFSIYNTMGSSPITRLSSLANTLGPESYQPKLGI